MGPQQPQGSAATISSEGDLSSSVDNWGAHAMDSSMSDSTVTTSPSILGFDDGATGEKNTYQLDYPSLGLPVSVCGTQSETISSLAWSPGISEDLMPWSLLQRVGTETGGGLTDWNEMPMPMPMPVPVPVPSPLPAPNPTIRGSQTSSTIWVGATPSVASGWTPNLHAPNPPPDPNALVNYFANVVSLDLVRDPGSPVTEIILPLCYSSGIVRDAACALAGLHMARTSVRNDCDHALFLSQALVGLPLLAQLDEDWAQDQVLATLLLLLYYEVLSQRSPSNLLAQHIQQAWQILYSRPSVDTSSSRLFDQAFRYFDVMNSLATSVAPLYPAPTPRPRRSQPSSPATPLSPDYADPPLAIGPAPDLLPTLHRFAELIILKQELDNVNTASQTSKAAVLRVEYETTCRAIEQALSAWEPPLPPGYTLVNRIVDGPPDASETDVARARCDAGRALAYKHGALVMLHRTGQSEEAAMRHAQSAMWHCVAASTTACMQRPGDGSVSGAGLLWPLLVGACELIEPRDRGMARQAFSAVDTAFRGSVNLGRSWELVLEVWRRRDLAAVEGGGYPGLGCMDWRRVAEEMGISLVLG
ncbi:hypothetical protein SODALDRAFT_307467 [Sodiomyces alkalinus F11]|uniref:Fungal-specific transcription factor domain-containing protein n=1 Tax=Sodiomyces alkalinus (strain CBS 110278 / VKM F-3762 / F11) TaxID=1314773 RepID=A0A3N2Q2K1_SODAK|nr:hypothetical protein SODALDRAFT_307467 [Sodiomyces alkalinus F11]ROT40980.1 hypothetical protein SODALDRAFT_307467 [Sodiomyces alkalinus F11]